MLGKSLRIPVWFIGFLVAVTVAAAAADRFYPQDATVTPNIFGLTVGDIYDRGVIVTDVALGSRARELGIRNDDVILEVNGFPVWSTEEFQRLVQAFAGGPTVFKVSRMGQVNLIIINSR